MMKYVFRAGHFLSPVVVATFIVVTLVATSSGFAQRGGGAGMGCMNSGAARMGNAAAAGPRGFLSNAAMLNQLAAMNRQPPASSQNRFNSVTNAQATGNPPRPTAQQFTQAAMRFDSDQNQQLDQTEIAQIAAAVVAEMQKLQRQRPNRNFGRATAATVSAQQTGTAGPSSVTQQLRAAFSKRAMDFDQDQSGTLNRT